MGGEFPSCAVSDPLEGDLVTNVSGLGNLRVTSLSLEQGPCRRTTSNPNCKRASEEEAHGGGDEPSACVRPVPIQRESEHLQGERALRQYFSDSILDTHYRDIADGTNSGYKTGSARAKRHGHPQPQQPRPPYRKSQSNGGAAPTIGHNQPIGSINCPQAGK